MEPPDSVRRDSIYGAKPFLPRLMAQFLSMYTPTDMILYFRNSQQKASQSIYRSATGVTTGCPSPSRRGVMPPLYPLK